MGIGLAVAAGGAASAAGSIFSSIFGAAASKQQAQAITESARIAKDTTLELDAKARGDVAPFRELGLNAGNVLWNMLNPDSHADASALFKQTPLFGYMSDIGNRNLMRMIQAQGLGGSGAGLEALARFNNQLVAEEGTRWMSNLYNLLTLGSNAASHMATNTTQAGGMASNALLQGGIAAAGANAQAGMQIAGLGKSLGDTLGNTIQNYAGYKMMEPLFNRLGNGGMRSTSVPLDFSLTEMA